MSAVVAVYLFGVGVLLALFAIIVLIPIFYAVMGKVLKKMNTTITSQKLFVSNIAHELRGPMAMMQIGNELVLHNESQVSKAATTRSKELVGAIRNDLDGLRQMSNIIKNLSLLTSMEYGAERPPLDAVNIVALLERLSDAVAKQMGNEKNITIHAERKAPMYVRGNESQLEQIIMNLLKNAVLYSPRGSHVHASTSRGGGEVRMSIQDNGSGIAKRDLAFIFNPFYRAAQDPAVKKGSGSGLGLAVVAALAKQNNATIQVESVLQKGTTMTLVFPALTHVAYS